MSWRLSFFYLPLWAIAEYLHGINMRNSLKCGVCHFDPLLYGRDWRAARGKVEQKLGESMKDITSRLDEKTRSEKDQREKLLAQAKSNQEKSPR